MHMDRIVSEEIASLFLQLVAIDSPSGHEQELADFIAKKLDEQKIMHERDAYGNIIAKVAGVGEPLLLAAHMDTVSPGTNIRANIVDGDLITTDGTTVLGADDKAGIVEILLALKYLALHDIAHRSLEIVFTREEESGLVGAKNLDYSRITAREGLVVDRSGAIETVVIASPFVSGIDIEIWGKSAHAGSPEHGINAIKVAADAIGKLAVGRIDEETTNNIGMMSGGVARNVVPEMARVHVDVRSHRKEKLDAQLELIAKIFQEEAQRNGAEINFSVDHGCHGYCYAADDTFITQAIDAWKQLGKVAILEKAGGASDANNFAERGIKVIDVGYGGIYPHTTREQIRISDMALGIQFLVEFVRG